MDDRQLLNQYVRLRSDDAFAQLVRRYVALVHSAARRQVQDSHLAQDVTQHVFMALARKAATLPATVVLASWLLTATRYHSSNANSVESRRKHHERRAAAMAITASVQPRPRAEWCEIEPTLDEALAELPEANRNAVVLRYFEDKSVREVAGTLGISEDAAKQRLSRGIRHLRAALASRGVVVSAAALAASLAANAVQAAPTAVTGAVIAAATVTPTAAVATSKAVLVARGLPYLAAAAVMAVVIGMVALAARDPRESGSTAGHLAYAVPGMDQVQVLCDQTYRQAAGATLWFDLYRPAGTAPKGGWPVVVLIHGGPVPLTAHPKDWPAYRSYGGILAASGLAAVTFNYRYGSPETLPDAASDVTALLEHVRRHAADLGIDPNRVALWAFSGSGPQLSVALHEPAPEYVRCLVSFYAALDTTSDMQRYSPLAMLRARRTPLPPMFIARMGKDDSYNNGTVDAFLTEAKQHTGPAIDKMDYPAGVHAFDTTQDTDESRAVIRGAIEFLKRHLCGA